MKAAIGMARVPDCLLTAALLTLGGVACDPAAAGDWARLRERMVNDQLKARGIDNERVLAVMGKVPRHEFVPPGVRDLAYRDRPLPIGHGQTISQPYVVALMTRLIDPRPEQRVLEVGTGSGYQAAVLAELVREVYTVELIPELGKPAAERLKALGYKNVQVRVGDGYRGWVEAAPFDAVVVTCGAVRVPEPLFEQLKPGGKMVIPVGPAPDRQMLQLITKTADGKREMRELAPVKFVPLRRPGKP